MELNDFNTVFLRRLRYYLKENDLTQAELAKKLGVGTTSVYNWCNGIKSPRMDKVDRMCEIFGCRRSDFMEEPASDSSPAVTLRPDESSLLSDYNRLNPLGRDEASKRVKELTRISEYVKKENSGSLSQVG